MPAAPCQHARHTLDARRRVAWLAWVAMKIAEPLRQARPCETLPALPGRRRNRGRAPAQPALPRHRGDDGCDRSGSRVCLSRSDKRNAGLWLSRRAGGNAERTEDRCGCGCGLIARHVPPAGNVRWTTLPARAPAQPVRILYLDDVPAGRRDRRGCADRGAFGDERL